MPKSITIEAIREEEPHSYALECEYFLTNKDKLPLSILEEETPLEKSRIYGPFSAEVLFWLISLQKRFGKFGVSVLNGQYLGFTLSHDADGREYLEY